MATPKQLVPVQLAATLPGVVSAPGYDRQARGCGIAHLGVGNFHRAHQALFLDEYLQTHAEEWMVHGVGCLDADLGLVQAMNTQTNLYSLTERSGTEDMIKIIGSIKKLSHAPSDPDGVIAMLASADIKIISLTITEKGYCYNPARDLDVTHPMIRADLREGALPTSALGYLWAAARQRMRQQGAPVTILSCDNLPGNGHLTRRLLLQLAERKEPAVARWIERNMSFPNSMVDRITPAVTAETRAFVRDRFGIDDRCPVVSEAFRQWVVEDEFINGRPYLETVGVQFTDDVAPYELLKVRLLNGTHSALAYVAYLLDHRQVDAAMRDPLVREFVQKYMDEDITPTIRPVPGVDIRAYKAQLLERFANPAISDQVQRLAMDGSQKLQNAVLPPLEYQLATGRSILWIAFALAAWFRYLRGVDDQGAPIEIVDPLRDVLVAQARVDPRDPIYLLGVQEIFGKQVTANGRVRAAIQECLEAMDRLGTREALRLRLRS